MLLREGSRQALWRMGWEETGREEWGREIDTEMLGAGDRMTRVGSDGRDRAGSRWGGGLGYAAPVSCLEWWLPRSCPGGVRRAAVLNCKCYVHTETRHPWFYMVLLNRCKTLDRQESNFGKRNFESWRMVFILRKRFGIFFLLMT
jgi:hypothetical protein